MLQRENAVDQFRAGEKWVLIATDVIARGMDFKGINCVINYDFPDSASAYIHRIGMYIITRAFESKSYILCSMRVICDDELMHLASFKTFQVGLGEREGAEKR